MFIEAVIFGLPRHPLPGRVTALCVSPIWLLHAGITPMTITKMISLDLFIFIHCTKSLCESSTGQNLHLTGRERTERCLLTLEPSDKAQKPIRGKNTMKQFEIRIVITSCLLSLVAVVTFHTGKSSGSLRRERIKSVNCYFPLANLQRARTLHSWRLRHVYPAEMLKAILECHQRKGHGDLQEVRGGHLDQKHQEVLAHPENTQKLKYYLLVVWEWFSVLDYIVEVLNRTYQ